MHFLFHCSLLLSIYESDPCGVGRAQPGTSLISPWILFTLCSWWINRVELKKKNNSYIISRGAVFARLQKMKLENPRTWNDSSQMTEDWWRKPEKVKQEVLISNKEEIPPSGARCTMVCDNNDRQRLKAAAAAVVTASAANYLSPCLWMLNVAKQLDYNVTLVIQMIDWLMINSETY